MTERDYARKVRECFEKSEYVRPLQDAKTCPNSHEALKRCFIEALEQVAKERDRDHEILVNTILDTKNQEIQSLRLRLARMESALIHIEEYWNRDANDGAMKDALDEIIFTAQKALEEDSHE